MSDNSQKKRPTLGIDASRANSQSRTGTEWYAYHVIQELKKIIPDSYRVVLYSREGLRDGLEDLPAGWESRVLRWRWRFWTQLRLSWEMLRRPPDVLFVPAHVLPVVLPRRAVTTLHDVGFLTVPDAYSWGERLYHRLAARFAVRRAARLLTVSEFSRGELVRLLGVEESDVAVTPISYDAKRFRASVVPTADAEPYFLFIGRLERKKNLPVLLEAFSEYVRAGGSARLKLAGKRGLGADEVLDNLSDEVLERVDELGYVAAKDLPALYASALAFVFPSRYEGFGIPVLEAFACGVPVIASDATSIPEVAGDAALLVSPDNVAGFAVAMRTVENDTDRREQMVAAGLARVQQYSWSKTAELTWGELRILLDKAQ